MESRSGHRLQRSDYGPFLYQDESPASELRRFYSADRRLPISICFPRQLMARCEFDKDQRLYVSFESREQIVIQVVREDLARLAERNDEVAARIIRQGGDITGYIRHDIERRKQISHDRRQGDLRYAYNVGDYRVYDRERDLVAVGEHFRAARIAWTRLSGHLGGEWVYFAERARPMLWTILWNSGEECDQPTFRSVISSFCRLSDDFFGLISRGG